MQYQKAQSAAKRVEAAGAKLTTVIDATLATIANIVGNTLGPGGRPVLLERYEHDLPPIVTKDGVTVFRALGFESSIAQTVMESARDAATRTANEAGDGTTTATVLAEAIYRRMREFCAAEPSYSPQRAIRELEFVFGAIVEPTLRGLTVRADLSSADGRRVLRSVAKISANGDEPLADAVMRCFDRCGDEGNVTIHEAVGNTRYVDEEIRGYPIPGAGYEDSVGQIQTMFINDARSQKVVLEKPLVVLYNGRLTDPQTLMPLLAKIGFAADQNQVSNRVLVVATGFSDEVKNLLGVNFAQPGHIKAFPLVPPLTIQANSQTHLLEDLASVTGAEILDPINHPLDTAEFDDLGARVLPDQGDGKTRWGSEIDAVEISRYSTMILGRTSDEDRVLLRCDELRCAAENAESERDAQIFRERLAKVSGGISRLTVYGPSNAETKEARDRAEDAICAVRGAIKHGCLYGGGWGLVQASTAIVQDQRMATEKTVAARILAPALLEPVVRLLDNVGLPKPQIADVIHALGETAGKPRVFDAMSLQYVDPREAGIYDSVPAVLEAIRSSLSIASRLGTLGGAVVFVRDREYERQEALDAAEFARTVDWNPADERAG